MSEFKRLQQSISNANNGLKLAFKSERNIKIHIGFISMVTCMGFYYGINKYEWCVFLILFSIVVGLELINTAIENMADYIQPKYDLKIKKIKDIAAAAVWFAAIISILIGILLFWDKI